MIRRLSCLIICAALIAALLAGCAPGGKAPAADDGRIKVVTTIFPPYDFARAVSGGLADVSMLLKPGAEVHSYDPSPADMIAIQECDVFIYIGGENDAWVDTVLASVDTADKSIVKLMDAVVPVEEESVEGMQTEEGHEHDEAAASDEHDDENADDHAHGEYDEHIWTSPKNAVLMVNAIRDAMAAQDSSHADQYAVNAAGYTAQIEAVDKRIAGIVEAASTKLIVVADRFPFRYFVDEFGLDYYAAFSGCSAESDVSAGTLAFLIDKVKETKLPYIYYIELSNRQVAQAVSEQTGAHMLLLHSCHNVTADDFAAGVTYVSLMNANADNLEKGLN